MDTFAARYFFDWASGCCLWSRNERTRAAFDDAIDHHALDLPTEVVIELDRLEAWRNTAMNWDSPGDPGPWRERECQAFNEAAAAAFVRLGEALGSDWELVDECDPLHEDPDLDRYLADPAGFER